MITPIGQGILQVLGMDYSFLSGAMTINIDDNGIMIVSLSCKLSPGEVAKAIDIANHCKTIYYPLTALQPGSSAR